jgi:hypothetical protein
MNGKILTDVNLDFLKNIFLTCGIALLFCVDTSAQSLVAAAGQLFRNVSEVNSIAVYPIEIKSGALDETLHNAASDEVEQRLTRKAKEANLKVVTRRQLDSLLSELKLSSTDKTSFDKLARSTGVDAVALPTGSVSKSGCLTVSINLIATKGEAKGEVISSAKPFKINTRGGELDMSGCD